MLPLLSLLYCDAIYYLPYDSFHSIYTIIFLSLGHCKILAVFTRSANLTTHRSVAKGNFTYTVTKGWIPNRQSSNKPTDIVRSQNPLCLILSLAIFSLFQHNLKQRLDEDSNLTARILSDTRSLSLRPSPVNNQPSNLSNFLNHAGLRPSRLFSISSVETRTGFI